jgi:hypothetical protein
VAVIEATLADDGPAVVLSDPSPQSILLDWTLADDNAAHDKARALLALIRGRNTHPNLPHRRARRWLYPHKTRDARSRRAEPIPLQLASIR